MGQKLTYDGVVDRYSYYYKTGVPPSYKDNSVPEPDKAFIRNMFNQTLESIHI